MQSSFTGIFYKSFDYISTLVVERISEPVLASAPLQKKLCRICTWIESSRVEKSRVEFLPLRSWGRRGQQQEEGKSARAWRLSAHLHCTRRRKREAEDRYYAQRQAEELSGHAYDTSTHYTNYPYRTLTTVIQSTLSLVLYKFIHGCTVLTYYSDEGEIFKVFVRVRLLYSTAESIFVKKCACPLRRSSILFQVLIPIWIIMRQQTLHLSTNALMLALVSLFTRQALSRST